MIKFISILLFFSCSAQASWTLTAEADVVLDNSKSFVDVKSDGTCVTEDEFVFTAKNETGRNKLALETITFLPESSTVEVLSASSVTDGVETPVDLKTIHERSAAGTASGVNSLKEKIIPFTNLRIGSSIKYKIRTILKKPMHPGVFSMAFTYGLQFPEMSGVAKIRSEKKLEFAFKDKDKILKIEEGKEGELFTLTITQLKPAIKKLKDEKLPIFNFDSFAQVQVTTIRNWGEFASDIAEKYEDSLEEPLPPVFQGIVDKAAKYKDPYGKIDIVISELATIMTYSGNWTTLEKMFYPRGHKEVAASKTGDCKDFATSTAAMLRKAGLKAHVALVGRKNTYAPQQLLQTTPIKDSLAMPSLFNHAIVRVELPSKKVIWVDPTNSVINSRVSNADIAGSYSLKLAKETVVLEKIPTSDANESVVKVVKNIKLNADETGETEGTVTMTGLAALSIMDTALRDGAKKANTALGYHFGSVLEDAGEGVKTENYKSRIAANIEAKFKTFGEKIYQEKDKKTYLFLPLPSQLRVYAMGSSRGRVTDFYSYVKSRYESKIQVDGFDFVDSESHGCYAVSPWVDVERKLIKNEKGFEVRDQVTFKKDLILAQEINEEEYDFSLNDLDDCIRAEGIQVVKLDRGSTLKSRLTRFNFQEIERLASLSGPGSIRRASEVNMIAENILETHPSDVLVQVEKIRAKRRMGYRSGYTYGPVYLAYAESELEAILKNNPENVPALVQKTFNLIYGDRVTEAATSFAKAYYTAKEKNYRLFMVGGLLSERMKKYQVAEGSYARALEVAKTDGDRADAYKRMGDIQRDLENYPKAESYYYSALKYDSENAWLMNDIVILALQKNDYDGAIVVGEKMLKVSDFGVGRTNLADAYGGKALQILDSQSQDVSRFEKASDYAMKGMKWSERSAKCMLALGQAMHETASLKKDSALAKRAMDISIKAMAYARGTEQVNRAVTVLNKASKLHSDLSRNTRLPSAVTAPAPAPPEAQ